MLTVRSLTRLLRSLSLFQSWRLPLLSFVDTPGADPRPNQAGMDIVEAFCTLAEAIWRYPGKMLGIVTGRCYGGASLLTLPAMFGGEKSLVLKGAQIGIMHDSLIEKLLDQTPKLLATWRQLSAMEKHSLADLDEVGLYRATVADLNEIGPFLDELIQKP